MAASAAGIIAGAIYGGVYYFAIKPLFSPEQEKQNPIARQELQSDYKRMARLNPSYYKWEWIGVRCGCAERIPPIPIQWCLAMKQSVQEKLKPCKQMCEDWAPYVIGSLTTSGWIAVTVCAPIEEMQNRDDYTGSLSDFIIPTALIISAQILPACLLWCTYLLRQGRVKPELKSP